jgi:indolepyruvate ferredoxin oxidoreductase alpha subunit
MPLELLLGDEAVALAAIHAGIAGAFSYPGTPATEIFEAIRARTDGTGQVSARWSANEKVAYEEALGMSYAGKRAIVSMKHVGLNVAADPFINSAITGVNGGLVVVVADDPGMHSSQNEQDSRFYGEFAQILTFEPCNQQEAYDLTREAFEVSERLKLPVLLRIVTRLAHSRASVRPADVPPRDRHAALPLPDPNDWTLVPANARRRFRRLLDTQPTLVDYAQHAPVNRLTLGGRRGIIAAGLAYNYVREVLGETHDESLLKIGTYPLPLGLLRDLVSHCDELLVVEEGYPLIEQRLGGLLGLPGKAVRGKLNGPLRRDGELTPEAVAAALGRPVPTVRPAHADLVGRPPQLCQGCPHADTFKAIVDAVAGFAQSSLFSDIGCYTLGALPPYRAVHSCVDMGASIAMAHGAAQAGAFPVLCTIGDSTFTHSGMTPLIGAVRADADMTVIILDNATVAMTGAQDTLATGATLLELLHGLGVRDVQVFEPHPRKHSENVALLARAIQHRGLSVLVAQRACIQIKRTSPAPAAAARSGCSVCQAAPTAD